MKNNHMPRASRFTQCQRREGGRPLGKWSGIRKIGKMTGIHDQLSNQRSSQRPGVSTPGGEGSRCRIGPTGLTVASAISIISQPTRLKGWRMMIRAASVENTTGIANPHPSAWTQSKSEMGDFCCSSHSTSCTSAPSVHSAASAQARRPKRFPRANALIDESPSATRSLSPAASSPAPRGPTPRSAPSTSRSSLSVIQAIQTIQLFAVDPLWCPSQREIAQSACKRVLHVRQPTQSPGRVRDPLHLRHSDAFESSERLSDRVRPAEFLSQDQRVFDRLGAALAEVGRHRVGGIADHNDSTFVPPRDRWEIKQIRANHVSYAAGCDDFRNRTREVCVPIRQLGREFARLDGSTRQSVYRSEPIHLAVPDG